MASKGLGPLPRKRGSALALGCDRGGRVVLPLARAAAVSTGLRLLLLLAGARAYAESRAGCARTVRRRVPLTGDTLAAALKIRCDTSGASYPQAG